jgi:hypothetical protein
MKKQMFEKRISNRDYTAVMTKPFNRCSTVFEAVLETPCHTKSGFVCTMITIMLMGLTLLLESHNIFKWNL